MPTSLSTTRSVDEPSTRVVTARNDVLIANGIETAKRDDGIGSALENAGIPLAVNGSFTGSWGTAGSITGVYYYAFRYIDDEGIPGSLSELQTDTAASESTISYSNIPISSDSRVAGRQIFRSTAGQDTELYLDVQLNDNSTTSTSSTKSDATLTAVTNPRLRINAPDGLVNARRFGVPPDHMGHVCYHSNHTIWTGSTPYSKGHASVTNGSPTVTIVGGTVTSVMDGRKFVVRGDTAEYTIDSVDTGANTLTLSTNYAGSTDPFASYMVFKGKEEWRRLYPSYPGEPESVYSEDAVDIDSDYSAERRIIAAYSFNSFVYVATPTRTYRWVFANDPRVGDFYPTEERGLLNKRCYCYVENQVACMDREGIYLFNGGVANPISNVISDWLRKNIFWHNARWFHASSLPSEETVKFFVCLDGSRYPRHSVCFNYRTLRWWWEEYPWPIASSASVPVAVRKEILYGGPQEMILLGGKYTDLPDQQRDLTARYSVSAATQMSVTLSSPDWLDEADVALGPIAIVSGRGKGQQRQVLGANTSSGVVKIDRPWSVQPDTTSKAVLGAVPYLMATKVFEVLPDSMAPGFELTVTPTDHDASLDIKWYLNYRETATDQSQRTFEDGAYKVTKGRPEVEVNIDRDQATGEWDGNIQFPIEAGHDSRGPARMRYVQIEAEGYQARNQIVLHGLDINGVE
jgi:hypothetical protein